VWLWCVVGEWGVWCVCVCVCGVCVCERELMKPCPSASAHRDVEIGKVSGVRMLCGVGRQQASRAAAGPGRLEQD